MTTLPNFLGSPNIRPGLDEDSVREMVFEFLSGDAVGQLSSKEMNQIIGKFPRLTEQQVITLGHKESVCPICFVPLLALLSEEETAIAMDSPAHPIEELGVTRLAEPHQCSHLFCRRDISRWVTDGHDSCPTCRRPLLERTQAEENSTDTSSPAEDAYGPAQLQDILQRLQGVGIQLGGLGQGREGAEGLDGEEIPFAASFPSFLFGIGQRSATHNNENDDYRGDYNAMYS
ncbi:hypothetical protein BDP27DRAFT_1314652 [Rhodocollybia butyracea]|uniref:RING-type domain-containing protein n=1 Tax=Rhodocollybia butyracea TaxID=206335 RepID=A0A9P5Q788_9AGAR|nr:hypothetical protein BDP27DRAFT_1314652 [Rhodocollybia butyracea]